MPANITTHPAFKAIITAQIQAFMLACPVSAALRRAARWDQLKAHVQDVARSYCSTFHAYHTRQLRALRVQAGHARAAYLTDPMSQLALDQLRLTAADLQQHRQQAATDALRAGVVLHEYGDQLTYYFHHLHKQRQQATVIGTLQQQPGSPQQICALWLAASKLTPLSTLSQQTASPGGAGPAVFRQLPTDSATSLAVFCGQAAASRDTASM